MRLYLLLGLSTDVRQRFGTVVLVATATRLAAPRRLLIVAPVVAPVPVVVAVSAQPAYWEQE